MVALPPQLYVRRRYVDGANVRRYLTCMKTVVSTKGQIILPAEIRRRDGVEPGQQFEVERVARGEYRLVRREPAPNEGLVDWLLACPEKEYFVPIESESTDTL
ncbi:MAG: Transcriptional regulator/antitoxin, MazE [Chloroflexi bacterium]|nr:Transcriptional regulator/antitoxin, MazE [Chloroflexota bacterium]